MILASVFAAFHYLALGIGLGAVFMRGRFFVARDMGRAIAADNFWGLAALLWLVTGLMRAFGGLEKGTEFYLHSKLFMLKLALFLGILALEIWPMITLIRWRIARVKGRAVTVSDDDWRGLAAVNAGEVALVLLIPLVASFMARGLGAQG
jgi:putative membrane protein